MFEVALLLFCIVVHCTLCVSDELQGQSCLIKSLIDARVAISELKSSTWKDELETEVATVKRELASVQNHSTVYDELAEKIMDINSKIDKLGQRLEVTLGEVYVRWGSKSCPETAEMVYSGFTAGSKEDQSGGGAHPICLSPDPTLDEYSQRATYYTFIYGSEYEVFTNKQNHDVPCTVCRTRGRSTVHMTPGKKTCEDKWTLEYDGYLMTEHYTHTGRTAFLCIDRQMDVITGGVTSNVGQLFYFVTPVCGTLKCPPYKMGSKIYLQCAVCSK